MSVYGLLNGIEDRYIAAQLVNSYKINLCSESGNSSTEEKEKFSQAVDLKLATSKDSAKKLSEVWQNVNELSETVTSLDEKSKDLEELLKKTHRFVKSYNAVLESMKEVSSLSLKREAQRLVEDTKKNAGNFAKIGISITNSGALEMDKNKFLSSKEDAVKSVFQETDTEQMEKNASVVKEDAKREMLKANTYNKTGAYSGNNSYALCIDL